MRGPRRLLLALALSACADPRYRLVDAEPATLMSVDPRCSVLVLHTEDGRMVAFRDWRREPDAPVVAGAGTRWGPDRREPISGPQRLDLREARLAECLAMEHGGSTGWILAATAGLALTGLIVTSAP